ncbi:hypothetical protein BGW42_004987 [Actinomortierella wolfii]|nr:hypothetical protein BGW42_004987 [Actinomortierella wolfii]
MDPNRRLRLRNPTVILFFSVTPFQREFSVEDTTIMFPLKRDTVPNWAAGVIAAAIPALVIAVIALGVRRSPYDFHNGILGLLVAVLLTTMLTQIIKATVGALRPDFLDRCQPRVNGTIPTTDPTLGLWTNDICTNTNKDILDEGRRAFPSGHASTCFAGLTYLSMWLAGKLHIFDRRGYSLKPVIVLVPLLGAILVAISRIRDYKHTATQVTWGGIIGIICALFSYHQYYPLLTSRTSHVPYPPRDFSYLVHSENQVPGQYEEEVREELGMSPRSSSSFHDHQQRPWSSQHQQQPSAALNNNGHPYDSQQRYKTSGQFVENGIEGRDHQQNNVSQPNPEDRTRGYLSEPSNNHSSSLDSPISVTVVGNGQSSPPPLQNQ